MKALLIGASAAAGIALTAMFAIAAGSTFAPGSRVQVWAHNAYPDHGKYADRLDRAISAGMPFMVEEDLAWTNGRSLLIHGEKNAAADDPTLESYFFPKVRPIMEKALAEGNRNGAWPLITLYLDIKNDPPEHLEMISKLLEQYDGWLTSAVKTADLSKQSPLELKPMLVLLEDKQNDIKKQFFYDRIPVGGKLRAFGSAAKYDNNADRKLSKTAAVDGLYDTALSVAVPAKADNYRRWWGIDWAYIEKGGETKAGEWNQEKAARLKKFVDYGHSLGYFVGVYSLSGWTEAENQGWDKDYNFGSRDAAKVRWQAAIRARADFISTDHYEELGAAIQASSRKP
jgi:hypothetical protein